MKNATYHVSCCTIYLFSDYDYDYDDSDIGYSGYYEGSGYHEDDEVGKSTKLAQFHK